MVKKRVIPCLDVVGGRVVKGVNFRNLREMGDPVELAGRYSELGADELVFLDITATLEGRGPMLDAIGRAADELTIPFTAGGGVTSFPIGRGEVVQVVGTATTDLGGTLVQADKPVQVISGMPCVYQPETATACDHIEESVPPAETLGEHYFVAPSTGSQGNVVGHIVRMFGNVDGTQLTYLPSPPPGAPATINAGQVVDLGVVTQAFEVTGSHEFAVGSFMLGGSIQDPGAIADQKGDPSMSLMTAVEQFRTKYVFLAPDDYDISYADVILPSGANVVIDGQPLSAPVTVASTTSRTSPSTS